MTAVVVQAPNWDRAASEQEVQTLRTRVNAVKGKSTLDAQIAAIPALRQKLHKVTAEAAVEKDVTQSEHDDLCDIAETACNFAVGRVLGAIEKDLVLDKVSELMHEPNIRLNSAAEMTEVSALLLLDA